MGRSRIRQRQGDNDHPSPSSFGVRLDNASDAAVISGGEAEGGGEDEEGAAAVETPSSVVRKYAVERRLHDLSADHYAFRKRLWVVPSVVAALIAGVAALVARSEWAYTNAIFDDKDIDSQGSGGGGGVDAWSDLLVIVAGCAGFASFFLQVVSEFLDYGSRATAHRCAAADWTARMEDDVPRRRRRRRQRPRPQQRPRQRGGGGEGEGEMDVGDDPRAPPGLLGAGEPSGESDDGGNGGDNNDTGADLPAREPQETRIRVVAPVYAPFSFETESSRCQPVVPARIRKTFDMLENHVGVMSLFNAEDAAGNDRNRGRRRDRLIFLLSNELGNVISSHWLWPLLTPNADRAVREAMRSVANLLDRDYRPRKKLRCGCFRIPLCCREERSDTETIYTKWDVLQDAEEGRSKRRQRGGPSGKGLDNSGVRKRKQSVTFVHGNVPNSGEPEKHNASEVPAKEPTAVVDNKAASDRIKQDDEGRGSTSTESDDDPDSLACLNGRVSVREVPTQQLSCSPSAVHIEEELMPTKERRPTQQSTTEAAGNTSFSSIDSKREMKRRSENNVMNKLSRILYTDNSVV